MVEYKTDVGLVFTDIDTKYYYQKRSEEKDFNIEVKGVLNTTFSEFTITMFSKIYDSYTRTYRKAPDLLADVGGVLNILYIIAKVMNFYIETKLKEADIFNICCSDSIENRKKNSSSVKIKTKTLELEYKDSRNENNNLIINYFLLLSLFHRKTVCFAFCVCHNAWIRWHSFGVWLVPLAHFSSNLDTGSQCSCPCQDSQVTGEDTAEGTSGGTAGGTSKGTAGGKTGHDIRRASLYQLACSCHRHVQQW